MTNPLEQQIADLAAAGFAGVVRLDVGEQNVLRAAYGAEDADGTRPLTPDTRLAMASGSKTFTALAVLTLVEDGVLALSTRARSLLGDDLPLIDDEVTVEHLLCHRSGIGDYLDEDAEDYGKDTYVMPVPVHRLDSSAGFLPILDGFPQKAPPGSSFSYCNGAFVVLAVLAERASGQPFHQLVQERVLDRAGLSATGYPRSDALPPDAALGHVVVDGQRRSNVFHLPVRGHGDGGAFTTVDDMVRFWDALHAGRIVSHRTLDDMLTPRSEWDATGEAHGLGIRRDRDTAAAYLLGSDAGVSCMSLHEPVDRVTFTVLGTSSESAWPVVRALTEYLGW